MEMSDTSGARIAKVCAVALGLVFLAASECLADSHDM